MYIKEENVAILCVFSLVLAFFVFPLFFNGTAAEDGAVVVVSHSSYIQYGTYREIFSGANYTGNFMHVVGEIQNVVAQNVEIDRISVLFYDNNGGAIVEEPVYTLLDPLDILTPGQKSPFEVVLLDENASERVATYEVSVESTVTTENPPVLKILDNNSYVSSGVFRVVGEVENSGADNVEYVKVLATVYNENGTVIGVDYTYTTMDIIVSGQKTAFTLNNYQNAEITPQIKAYNLSVTGTATAKEPYREFQTSNTTSSINVLGDYEIRGEVQNVGGTNATFVKIIASFYDSDGGIVDSDYSYSAPRDLAAGQTGEFRLYTSNAQLSPKIASYTLQVECFEVSGSISILTPSP